VFLGGTPIHESRPVTFEELLNAALLSILIWEEECELNTFMSKAGARS
jgi:hypothetical protein